MSFNGKLMAFVLLVMVTATFSQTVNPRQNSESILYQSLFQDYTSQIRPTLDSKQIIVTVQLYLHKLYGISVIEQSMKTTLYMYVMWEDELLKWDPADFNGTTNLIFPYDKNIWIPDLTITNSEVQEPSILGIDGAYIALHHNGSVILLSEVTLESSCRIEIRKFPFDEQNCEVTMTTTLNVEKNVKIRTKSNEFPQFNAVTDVAEWYVVSNSAEESMSYLTCHFFFCDDNETHEDTSFMILHYKLKLQRTCTSCVFNIILPVMILAGMNLFTFFVPCESGEKTVFPITVFLSLAVFLTVITNSLPESVDGIPYISMLVTNQICIGSLTLLTTVASLTLFHNKTHQIPKIAQILVKYFNKDYRRRCSRRNKTEDCNTGTDKCCENQDDDVSMETECIKWCDVSKAFDRLMFYVFTVFEIITFCVILILMTY